MLPPSARLRRRSDFAAARHGRRGASRTVVVHCAARSAAAPGDGPRVGFAVSRAVGTAVVRNRVTRRLRHAYRDRLPSLMATDVVVRALPAAATASYDRLASDLDRCLHRAGALRPPPGEPAGPDAGLPR